VRVCVCVGGGGGGMHQQLNVSRYALTCQWCVRPPICTSTQCAFVHMHPSGDITNALICVCRLD
jgi:hypothetical protein